MPRAARVLLLTLLAATGGARATSVSFPPIVAESSGFEATSSYDETVAYLGRLAEVSPEIELSFIGTSPQGRPIPLVVAASGGTFTPQTAAQSGKAVILVQSAIHAGEVDGKDASLLILRDLAAGKRSELLKGAILLFVPILNVDGHERVSPFNRANQNGPILGMGFRTTSDGHDLNRDHLKLTTPEARAAVGLFNRWRPHLHVDNHVTDGVDHDWVLTYTWAEAPQVHEALQAWTDSAMPDVLEATRRGGHRIGPYAALIDRSNPAMGINSYIGAPRYATGYYPLRNRVSILVENHSYKPYRDRVMANRDFLLSLFEAVSANPRPLIDAVARAEAHTVALGKTDAEPSEVPLRFEVQTANETVHFPVYDWYIEPSSVMGVPLLRYMDGKVLGIEVPWVHRVRATATLPRPRGYLVLPGWPVIEERLAAHGLRVLTLDAPLEVYAETIRISDPEPVDSPGTSYQGLYRIRTTVKRQTELRSLPAGTLWIPADQPDFQVAVQLFEPDAEDSLVGWGLLSIVLERKEYIEPRQLELLAADLLRDPQIASEWERALEDQSLAENPGARYRWWYRRTSYWDDDLGLVPTMRLMEPPTFRTSPWSGPRARTE